MLKRIFNSKKNELINNYGRLAVYTAIIGKYDNLLTQNSISQDCDYYCITDNKDVKSKTWNIIYFDKNNYGLNNVEDTKVARFIKTHPHIFFKNYKHSLWIDSNMVIEKDVLLWISKYLENGKKLLVHKHSDRENLNQEIKEILDMRKDTYENIEKQVSKYTNEGFDLNAPGLVMTNVIYRLNSKEIIEFNEKWWNEIYKNSKRDQLSFNYVAWKCNLNYSLCDLDPFGNKYFSRYKHSYK